MAFEDVTNFIQDLPTPKPVQFISQANGNSVVSLDCSINEDHQRKSVPTKFPIESGSNISDHIIIEPFTLKFKGMITDTPFSTLTSLLTTAVSAILPGPAKLLGAGAPGLALASGIYQALDTSDPLSRPSAKAYFNLLTIQAAGLPVNVLTSLYLYKNMWITSISVPRDSKTGRCLIFDIELQQLLIVSPATTNITVLASPNVGAGQAGVGTQNANQGENGEASAPPGASQAEAGYNAGLSVFGVK